MRRLTSGIPLVALALMLLAPTPANAQSGIAGLVTDESGAVLPGVTVEAASPVLIEKVRSAVTDARGRFEIIDLRPGAYTVTFTLPGFATTKRDGIDLPMDFKATVNGELKVGSLEETVTVSGASPVVDVRSATQSQALTRTLIDDLPSQRTLFGSGGVIPGVRMVDPDVGGQRMMQHGAGALQVHGLSGGENAIQIDGMLVNGAQSDGSVQAYHNDALTEEFSYQTSAVGAEVSHGGLRQNMIPRQGGNTFSGVAYAGNTPRGWTNTTPPADLLARGLTVPTSIDRIYDYNFGEGGKIVADKLWFFGSVRRNSVNDIVAGVFKPDGSPAVTEQWIQSLSLRLTLQATPRNKLTAYYDRALKEKTYQISFGQQYPEATARRPWRNGLYYVGQGKWTSTITSQMMLEVGHSQVIEDYLTTCHEGVMKERGTPEWFATAARVDLDRGTVTTACTNGASERWPRRYVETTGFSYVNGSHNFKLGMQWSWGPDKLGRDYNADLFQQYKSGVPDSVQVWATPFVSDIFVNADRGIYAQDAWTIKRLTATAGVRFDHFNSRDRNPGLAAGRFVPGRDLPEVKNLPNWNDVAPRFSAAYDVFGDGRTAIKGGVNKYMKQWTGGFARRYSPLDPDSVEQRNWTDLNKDDIAQDNEIGPSNNVNFGKAASRHPADDIQREYTWEYMASVQREIVPGVSLIAGWYRRTWHDLERQDNLLINVSDYASFQVANPLPGQNEQLTLFNLNRAKQGQVDILDTTSVNDGRTYTGFEINGNARLPRGVTIFGGWTTMRTVETACEGSSTGNTLPSDNPNKFRFCDQSGRINQQYGQNAEMPFRWDAKISASIPLPYAFRASMAFQSVSGDMLNVNWAVPATAFPGGRTAPVTVRLISPGTKYLPRRNQLDLAFRRNFQFGRMMATPGLDIFNGLNNQPVLSQNQNFGSSLDNPQSTLLGRMLRASLNVKW